MFIFLHLDLMTLHIFQASHFQFAVLDAKNEKMQEKSVCLGYSTKMTSFPRENGVRFAVDEMIIIINKHIFLNQAYMPLVDLSEKWSGCNGSLIEETASVSIKGHIVMVNQAENCSIYERAKSVMVWYIRFCVSNPLDFNLHVCINVFIVM